MIKQTILPRTLEEAKVYAHKNDRIVVWARYGEHIPLLCKAHPEKRWSTKNIQYIGARSLFYNLSSKVGMGSECSCSANLLEPVVPENWQELIVPLQIVSCRCCGEELAEELHFNASHCRACFDARCMYPKKGSWDEVVDGSCKAGKQRQFKVGV